MELLVREEIMDELRCSEDGFVSVRVVEVYAFLDSLFYVS